MTTRTMTRTFVSLAVMLAAASAYATPWFTQDPRTLPQGKWRIEEHIMSSKTDTSVVDGDKVPLAAGKEATTTIYHTRVRYGATDDLTLFADLPYVERELTLNDGSKLDTSGMGDLTFLAKYKYYDDPKHKTRRAVAAFLKPHTGDYNGLPPLLSSGTGTTNLGLVHLWELGTGSTTWYSSMGYVFVGERDDTGVEPGDVFTFNLAAEHQLADKSPWRFVWELNGQYQQHAERNGATVPGSAGTAVYVSPGIQHVRKSNGKLVQLEAGVQIPVFYDDNVGALQDYQIYAGGFVVF